jgi:hypothetical protein
VKTITIRLPDVEAAMLIEVQKKKPKYREIEKLLNEIIRQEYSLLASRRG